jgi:hypothetical protein
MRKIARPELLSLAAWASTDERQVSACRIEQVRTVQPDCRKQPGPVRGYESLKSCIEPFRGGANDRNPFTAALPLVRHPEPGSGQPRSSNRERSGTMLFAGSVYTSVLPSG